MPEVHDSVLYGLSRGRRGETTRGAAANAYGTKYGYEHRQRDARNALQLGERPPSTATADRCGVEVAASQKIAGRGQRPNDRWVAQRQWLLLTAD
jgi:hypothetical protein